MNKYQKNNNKPRGDDGMNATAFNADKACTLYYILDSIYNVRSTKKAREGLLGRGQDSSASGRGACKGELIA